MTREGKINKEITQFLIKNALQNASIGLKFGTNLNNSWLIITTSELTNT